MQSQFYFNSNFFTNKSQNDIMNEQRQYLDPIHGYISFDNDIWNVIDTPQFQRLRDIKQLGCCNLVFAGGTHTRFEHSIGVAYLSQKYFRKIIKQQPSLIQNEEYRNQLQKNVTTAGLVHDIGHGPFSHLFEGVIKQIQVVKQFDPYWCHENMSSNIIQHLIDENHIDYFQNNDIVMIKNLIKGHNPYKHQIMEQDIGWIFDIVANKRNSIDVDKFDYLLRDAYHVGYKDQFFDYKTIMKNSLVVDSEICYNSKMATKIYDLFSSRYKMFKQVYLNRISIGIDLMIKDILMYANPHYNFADVDKYLTLTDTILQNIESSNNFSLLKSKELIKKLKRREIYKFVNEVIISSKLSIDSTEKMRKDIICYAEGLNMEDIDIYVGEANYCFKDQNPVDSVKFFKKPNFQNSFNLTKNQVSLLLPQTFSEKFLRLYVKNTDQIEKANQAFIQYCNKHLNHDLVSQVKEDPTTFNSFYKQRSQQNTPIKKTKIQ